MTNNTDVKFEILHMAPENTNSLLVTSGDDAVIIDAWGRATAWEKLLTERGLHLRAIYTTHGHSDHISAAPELATRFNVPWYMNHADMDLVLWGNPLLDFFEMPHIKSDFTRPENLSAGEYEILPNVWMQAINAPGHSAGGMMFLFPDYDILMSGDTFFRDGVGRTDFPGGDAANLRKSIYSIIDMNLPDQTYVVHGHGIDSTIGWLKSNHPYFLMRHCKCGAGDGCCGHNHDCGDGHCCCGRCHNE